MNEAVLVHRHTFLLVKVFWKLISQSHAVTVCYKLIFQICPPRCRSIKLSQLVTHTPHTQCSTRVLLAVYMNLLLLPCCSLFDNIVNSYLFIFLLLRVILSPHCNIGSTFKQYEQQSHSCKRDKYQMACLVLGFCMCLVYVCSIFMLWDNSR